MEDLKQYHNQLNQIEITMKEKNILKINDICSDLHFIEVGAKQIKDRSKKANIDIMLNNYFPRFILEEIHMKHRKKYQCDWLSNGNLFIKMKYSSVELRKIK